MCEAAGAAAGEPCGSNDVSNTQGIAANDLVKVGGQEFLVSGITNAQNRITLNEPFLGSSIIPILTDTGATAESIDSTVDGMKLTTVTGVTTSNTDQLKAGAKLYVQGEPVTSSDAAVAATDGSGVTANSGAGVDEIAIENTESLFWFNAAGTNLVEKIFRRTDNPDNQNFYKAADDDAAETTESYCGTRGLVGIYACATLSGGNPTFTTALTAATGKPAEPSAGDTEQTVGAVTGGAQDALIWTGIHGPFQLMDDGTAGKLTWGKCLECEDAMDFMPEDLTDSVLPIYRAVAPTETIAPSTDVLLINGRRYKVDSVETTAYAPTTAKRVELTETFSGQHFMELCNECVEAVATAAGVSTLTIADTATFNLDKGDLLLFGGDAQLQTAAYVDTDYDGAADDVTTARAITTKFAVGTGLATADGSSNAFNLYKATAMNGFKPVIITERAAQATYQYVSQCSNRGSCDGSTGLCGCYKGYTNDNCDTQNMLAI